MAACSCTPNELQMMPFPAKQQSTFVDIPWRGRMIQIELDWVGVAVSEHPTVVFLHEGLGSVALWKDFPERFCRVHGLRGLVFSRHGYGRSTPRPPDEPLTADFMHYEADVVLPALLARLAPLGIVRPWLFGHSDGASIALLHAARHGAELSGVVVAAPHIMVEEIGLASIRQAREAYLHGTLRARLAQYHQDVDSAFWGWNDIWLDPVFRGWDIRGELANITVPVLAIQGEGDEYGTLEQVRGIQRLAPHTQLMILPDCGHSPHRDQAARIIAEAGRFILGHPGATRGDQDGAAHPSE
jgi:pimeloyl-ACP methyl ester carboxylesterase